MSCQEEWLRACQGPDPDVSALEWPSALLAELGSDRGGAWEWMSRTEDPGAMYHAYGESCRLLDRLRAAVKQAEGGPPEPEPPGAYPVTGLDPAGPVLVDAAVVEWLLEGQDEAERWSPEEFFEGSTG